jgi:hypothetical protein
VSGLINFHATIARAPTTQTVFRDPGPNLT